MYAAGCRKSVSNVGLLQFRGGMRVGSEGEEKVKIAVIVGSGAVAHVIPEHQAPMFKTKEAEVSRSGKSCTVANGESIHDQVQKVVTMITGPANKEHAIPSMRCL